MQGRRMKEEDAKLKESVLEKRQEAAGTRSAEEIAEKAAKTSGGRKGLNEAVDTTAAADELPFPAQLGPFDILPLGDIPVVDVSAGSPSLRSRRPPAQQGAPLFLSSNLGDSFLADGPPLTSPALGKQTPQRELTRVWPQRELTRVGTNVTGRWTLAHAKEPLNALERHFITAAGDGEGIDISALAALSGGVSTSSPITLPASARKRLFIPPEAERLDMSTAEICWLVYGGFAYAGECVAACARFRQLSLATVADPRPRNG
eukprot:gene44472-26211_t